MMKKNVTCSTPEDRALDLFAQMMIEKIELISSDWKKPWFCEGAAMQWPRNISGREYNGMNAFMLMMLCEKNGYKNPFFLTFDRCMALNYVEKKGKKTRLTDESGKQLPIVHVLKGEKSFPVFITTFTCVNPDTHERIKYDDYKQMNDDERKKWNVYPKLQTYQVFNIDQTNIKEARPELYSKLCDEHAQKPFVNEDDFHFDAVDVMIKDNLWICPIKTIKGDDCYYSISKNEVITPVMEQFKNNESFYSNLFHEMAHSTGAMEVLNRLKPAKFGSSEYAREELVAEMTAALTASRYGMTKCIKEDSAAYLKSWLKSLKESPDFIKTILTDVKKAASILTQKIDLIIEGQQFADSKKEDADLFGEKKEKEVSPMLRQFMELKKKHPDALLLFRCGDFYETYLDDAVKAADILGITLTVSSKTKDANGNPLKMAGFPFHALDTYLPKLIRNGCRVAICDEIQKPQAKTKKKQLAKAS